MSTPANSTDSGQLQKMSCVRKKIWLGKSYICSYIAYPGIPPVELPYPPVVHPRTPRPVVRLTRGLDIGEDGRRVNSDMELVLGDKELPAYNGLDRPPRYATAAPEETSDALPGQDQLNRVQSYRYQPTQVQLGPPTSLIRERKIIPAFPPKIRLFATVEVISKLLMYAEIEASPGEDPRVWIAVAAHDFIGKLVELVVGLQSNG
ncbi:hypothetical protein DFH06DRAFT_1136937 [Mycena polygramma]|nr:hypothetical protein DFH06DRAFT_1136937 [Mycena polygramma]